MIACFIQHKKKKFNYTLHSQGELTLQQALVLSQKFGIKIGRYASVMGQVQLVPQFWGVYILINEFYIVGIRKHNEFPFDVSRAIEKIKLVLIEACKGGEVTHDNLSEKHGQLVLSIEQILHDTNTLQAPDFRTLMRTKLTQSNERRGFFSRGPKYDISQTMLNNLNSMTEIEKQNNHEEMLDVHKKRIEALQSLCMYTPERESTVTKVINDFNQQYDSTKTTEELEVAATLDPILNVHFGETFMADRAAEQQQTQMVNNDDLLSVKDIYTPTLSGSYDEQQPQLVGFDSLGHDSKSYDSHNVRTFTDTASEGSFSKSSPTSPSISHSKHIDLSMDSPTLVGLDSINDSKSISLKNDDDSLNQSPRMNNSSSASSTLSNSIRSNVDPLYPYPLQYHMVDNLRLKYEGSKNVDCFLSGSVSLSLTNTSCPLPESGFFSFKTVLNHPDLSAFNVKYNTKLLAEPPNENSFVTKINAPVLQSLKVPQVQIFKYKLASKNSFSKRPFRIKPQYLIRGNDNVHIRIILYFNPNLFPTTLEVAINGLSGEPSKFKSNLPQVGSSIMSNGRYQMKFNPDPTSTIERYTIEIMAPFNGQPLPPMAIKCHCSHSSVSQFNKLKTLPAPEYDSFEGKPILENDHVNYHVSCLANSISFIHPSSS